jgi:hypothetical protein
VSCGGPGDCSAGGSYYVAADDDTEAFVATEAGGTWGDAQEVPGTPVLNATGFGAVNSVSCTSGGYCSAVGYAQAGASGLYNVEAFVDGGGPTRPTSTSVTLSAAKVAYGGEQSERVTVTVAAGAGETPAGTVRITSGSSTDCTATLAAGTGSCTIPPAKFAPGSVAVTAAYGGNYLFSPSVSAAAGFAVTKARSRTSLALSAAKVIYGREQAERLKVSVSPQYSGTPTGTVTVRSGATTVCLIRLASEVGSCRLSRRELQVGRHELVASYSGNGNFAGSSSARRKLVVSR